MPNPDGRAGADLEAGGHPDDVASVWRYTEILRISRDGLPGLRIFGVWKTTAEKCLTLFVSFSPSLASS